MIKIIGVISMVIDHVGSYLLPDYIILRVIGRLAFPLFACSLAEGFFYSKDLGKYGLRLALAGLAAQPIFSCINNSNKLNICFTLALGLFFLYLHYRWSWYCIFLLPAFYFVEYGLYAPCLFFIFYYYISPLKLKTEKINKIKAFIGMAAAALIFYPGGLQILSLIALPLILCKNISLRAYPKLSTFYYVFYPAHLLVIGIISIYPNVIYR